MRDWKGVGIRFLLVFVVASVLSLKVERPIFYENFVYPKGELSRAAKALEELKPDFIWYSFLITGVPLVSDEEAAEKLAEELKEREGQDVAERFLRWVAERGYYGEALRKQVALAEKESALYCPCVLVQNLRVDFNYDPDTFEVIPKEKLEKWKLDFSRWGLETDVEESQELFANAIGLHEGVAYPDLTDPEFRDYLVRKVLALKKYGVKCVWLDSLFGQARAAYFLTHDYSSPAVREAYDAALEVLRRLKEEGLVVGTWAAPLGMELQPPPPVDFVTLTFTSGEILEVKVDEGRLGKVRKVVDERLGKDVPLLVVFDFGNFADRPLPTFALKLNDEERAEFLRKAWEACERNGCALVMPVKGGYFGSGDVDKLAYGRFRYYDSRAPEFPCYSAILRLMRGGRIGAEGG